MQYCPERAPDVVGVPRRPGRGGEHQLGTGGGASHRPWCSASASTHRAGGGAVPWPSHEGRSRSDGLVVPCGHDVSVQEPASTTGEGAPASTGPVRDHRWSRMPAAVAVVCTLVAPPAEAYRVLSAWVTCDIGIKCPRQRDERSTHRTACVADRPCRRPWVVELRRRPAVPLHPLAASGHRRGVGRGDHGRCLPGGDRRRRTTGARPRLRDR